MLIACLFAFATSATKADIPDRSQVRLNGMYKVISSNDPIFPVTTNSEWFMDFGNGTLARAESGTVAVSLRQNPSVRVRLMVWQFFPDQSALVIGNQVAEGSSGAVARGAWSLTETSQGIIFQRDRFQMVVQRAHPSDY